MSAISRFFDWIFFAEVQKQSLPKKEPRWWTQMIAAGLFVVVVLLAVSIMQYNFVKSKFPVSEDVARFGISGDFFGFSNAVFSALAFSTIIVTLWMQKHELRQQRLELDQTQDIMSLQINEMELQRQEMLQQRQEMQDQNESLRRQRFENTFFGMLELHNQVVSGVASPVGGSSGRAAFSMFLSALREINRNQLTGQQPALKENVDL
jgi:hypothetical protein